MDNSQPDFAIIVSNMSKWFGKFKALSDINLKVKYGERVVICGPSGSGKSTLIRCLNKLELHQEGSVIVNGYDLDKENKRIEEIRRDIGMVFQSFNLFPHLTVLENCVLAQRRVLKRSKASARETAIRFLTQVKIPEQSDKFPAQLSGGQQQRVAIARALCLEPKIMLFDEPTSGLDPITGGVIDRLIIDSVRRLGATAITISHDMASVRRIADKVAMVHNGTIIWCGPASEMDDTGIAEVDQFVHGHADGPLTRAAKAEARAG